MKFPLLLLCSLLASGAPSASALNLLTEENPPLNFMHEGRLTGLAPGVVEEIAKRAKLDAKVRVAPWKEAYETAQSDANTCVFSIVRTSARFELFQWVGPITRSYWSAFALPDFAEKIAKADDLKAYRIGVVRDARADHLRKSGFGSLTGFDADRDIPARLTLDRKQADGVDIWITQGYMAQSIARAAGVPAVKEVFSSLMSQDYFIGCSPSMPKDRVKAMTGALAEMRKDGSLRRISAASIEAVKALR